MDRDEVLQKVRKMLGESTAQTSRDQVTVIGYTIQPRLAHEVLAEIDAALLASKQAQQEPVSGVVDERKAFDKWHRRYGKGFVVYSDFNSIEEAAAWKAWQARAALQPAQTSPQGEPVSAPAVSEQEGLFAAMRAEAAKRNRDQAVTPEYAAWLDEQAKQGIEAHGGNEIWNAATKAALTRPAPDAAPVKTAPLTDEQIAEAQEQGKEAVACIRAIKDWDTNGFIKRGVLLALPEELRARMQKIIDAELAKGDEA